MLKSAQIRGLSIAQSRTLDLPYRDNLQNSPYFIKKAGGLGPVKADINKSSYPDIDGDYYHSSRVGGRNIVLQIGLNPRPGTADTVQGLRRGLYKILPPKTPVRFILNDDDPTIPQMYVDGWIESVDPSIFDKNTDVIVSILAMGAYLKSTTIVKNQGYKTNVDQMVNYLGDAPTPIEFSMKMTNRAPSYIRFVVNGTGMFTVTYGFQVGDTFGFNTRTNGKDIYRIRDGVKGSLLDQVSAGSLDLVFDAATDRFRAENNFGNAIDNERYSLTYTPSFVGI